MLVNLWMSWMSFVDKQKNENTPEKRKKQQIIEY